MAAPPPPLSGMTPGQDKLVINKSERDYLTEMLTEMGHTEAEIQEWLRTWIRVTSGQVQA